MMVEGGCCMCGEVQAPVQGKAILKAPRHILCHDKQESHSWGDESPNDERG